METDDIFLDLGNSFFSEETTRHIISSLFIALQGILFGYIIRYKNYSLACCAFDVNSIKVKQVRKLTYILIFWIYPFVLLELFEKVFFVITHDYFALYTDFKTRLPYFIIIISSSFEIVFAIFLATMPSKNEIKTPVILFVFIGIINLGTGQRGTFILNILLIISYYFFRNSIDKQKKIWITRKQILLIIISIPLILSFLFIYAYFRVDVDMDTSYNILLSFFYQQSVSADVIGFGYDYDHKFPEGRLYIFGDIIDYFRHNFVAQLLWQAKAVEPQSVEHALRDYSFDDALTYLVKPREYLNGLGLGGCYIAEAWHDFGYIGVFFISFIYGRLLSLIPKWLRKNFWYGSVALLMYLEVIYSPRSRADKPIYIFFSMVVWGIYLFLYMRVYNNKKYRNLI